jgi:hypothetical protein
MTHVVPSLQQTTFHLNLEINIICCSSSEHGICDPFTLKTTFHLH